jgi:D-xylose transport system ATP-binding protein
MNAIAAAAPLLEMRNIGKNFPGIRALDGVTFDLFAGEIHALVGENGAGKSTLMKILGGVYAYGSFDGEIRIAGEGKQFRSVSKSEAAGVAVVFQELSLVPELTVGENIFLGREPGRLGIVRWDELYSSAAEVLDELKLNINPRAEVGRLGTGERQLVEIAKALSQRARILVLDEPTAALTGREAEALFHVLAGLRDRGIGTIYISHRLNEVFQMSDRITVLRDGRSLGTRPTASLTEQEVIAQMVGRDISHVFPTRSHTTGEIALEVRNLSAKSPTDPDRSVVDKVSFVVRRGEVLGIAGLIGAGRSELLMSIFGAFPGVVTGEVLMGGKPLSIKRPADAIAGGIGLVGEDRKQSGLILDQSILVNITLAALPRLSGPLATDEFREIEATRPLFAGLKIKADSLFTIVGTLSGGNQQKVVLAKWLLNNPKALLLDEPTRGVDVGAKQEIYLAINDLAASGMAVVVVSSELPEVLGLADRILVLHEGRITGEFMRDEATPEGVMSCATGVSRHV